VNLLPSMSEEDGNLMEAIANSPDLDIFTSEPIQDIIEYRWAMFAARIHWFGWLLHMLYIISLQMYITEVYLIDDKENLVNVNFKLWLNIIGGCLMYPTIYDGR
jgi:hypothetical protein